MREGKKGVRRKLLWLIKRAVKTKGAKKSTVKETSNANISNGITQLAKGGYKVDKLLEVVVTEIRSQQLRG